MTCFSHPPLFDAPTWGNLLEFLDKLTPQKLEGWSLLYGENFIILT